MDKMSRARFACVATGLIFLLSACGGSGNGDVSERSAPPLAASTTASNPSTEALLAKGAQLSRAGLSAAENESIAADRVKAQADLDQLGPDQVAPKSAYTSGEIRQKAADKLAPVWRFYNSATGAHFVTLSTTERDQVVANLSPPKGSFQFEGQAFLVANAPSPGLSPVHRFYNTQTGVHFYTINESERAHIVATLPQFTYEGIAYHASRVAGQGMTPLYRFYVPSKGFHFFTASLQERDAVIANLSATYHYEGTGYHVLVDGWQPEPEPPAVIPHSGTRASQCFVATHLQYTHQPCTGADAAALNPQQDGHRLTINAMSYSAVGAHPLTSCVRDNVTGLIWEGKTGDGGPRSLSQRYTNTGNNEGDDASGYTAYVNGLNLCGYSDWRLPTLQELLGIVDHGRHQPSLQTDWFPNWGGDVITYWTADRHGGNNRYVATVTFSTGPSSFSPEGSPNRVRLVRGHGHTASRFSYGTVAYGGDGINNVVIDAWTGLQWRRCEQGRTWNGSTCAGTAITFNHAQALPHARDQSGWRLPNVKELASLLVIGPTSGATLNPTAFPGALAEKVWSSTPTALGTVNANFVDFLDADVGDGYRFHNYFAVRLVRILP